MLDACLKPRYLWVCLRIALLIEPGLIHRAAEVTPNGAQTAAVNRREVVNLAKLTRSFNAASWARPVAQAKHLRRKDVQIVPSSDCIKQSSCAAVGSEEHHFDVRKVTRY